MKEFEEDGEGRIWMVGPGGVSVWAPDNGENLMHFTQKEGLADNFERSCILRDRDGKIWIGSRNKGLSVWHPPKDGIDEGFTYYTTENGLSHNNIWSLHEDKRGDIWVGTVKGLNRIRKLDDETLELKTYLHADGLGGVDVREILMDVQDRLWLAGPAGLDVMDLSTVKPDTTRPNLTLNDIQID